MTGVQTCLFRSFPFSPKFSLRCQATVILASYSRSYLSGPTLPILTTLRWAYSKICLFSLKCHRPFKGSFQSKSSFLAYPPLAIPCPSGEPAFQEFCLIGDDPLQFSMPPKRLSAHLVFFPLETIHSILILSDSKPTGNSSFCLTRQVEVDFNPKFPFGILLRGLWNLSVYASNAFSFEMPSLQFNLAASYLANCCDAFYLSLGRSEERSVGKAWRSRRARRH